MFTGLIKEKGKVAKVERAAAGAKLTLEAPLLALRTGIGDSVSVNGACLTISAKEGARLFFDLSVETLSKTTLGELHPGDRVNLEDALTPNTPLGGHFVLGHVDGVGRVASRYPVGEMVLMTFRVPHDLSRYLVAKGSVAVDGISLTVNEIRGDTFSVSLIPRTLEMVTLGDKKAGDPVNIEVDVLAKTVERLLGRSDSPPGGK